MRTSPRVVSIGLALTLLVGGFVAATPAQAAPRAGAYVIGDSVAVGAKPALRSRGIKVNATVSRHFYSGPSVVQKLRAKGKLPRKVVIALGTNSSGITVAQCKNTVRAAGPSRTVWFVTVRGVSWAKANNRVLHRCAAQSRARLIPWKKHAAGKRGWFWDGMHLTPSGARAYAAFIDRYV